jgi:uncharacterized protein with PQ loop repeat
VHYPLVMDSTSLAINLLGFVATATSIFLWVPQARITWRNRNDAARLAGISSSTQWLVVISGLFWITYGVLADSFWVMAPCFLSVPLALATIFVIRRGRKLPPPTISVPIIDSSEFLESSLIDTAFLDATTAFLDTTEIVAENTQTSSIPIVVTGESADVGVPIMVSGESADAAESTTPAAPEGSYSSTGSIPVLS